jgi:hypothetical protein
MEQTMTGNAVSDAAIRVVRPNTEEVQSKRNFDAFEELFADDFVDHDTGRRSLRPQLAPYLARATALHQADTWNAANFTVLDVAAAEVS